MTLDEVTKQAQAMSAINGASPEQNAYSILKSKGLTNAQMDAFYGFAPGSVDKVFGPQDGAGVSVGGTTPSQPAFNPTGMRPIYAQKTVERQGAPMQMDDTSNLLGYMNDNGDGTYSNYSPTGELQKTYKANTGFANGLSQTLDSIVSDKSGVIGNFALPAAAMGYGSGLLNGSAAAPTAAVSTGSGVIASGPFAGATGAELAAANGVIASGPFAGATGAELAAANAGASGTVVGGSAVTGATGAAATGAATKGLLDTTGGKIAAVAGGLLGAAGSQDTTTTSTSSKDPWSPAQPYLVENLKRNAVMQNFYRDNPFSKEQKSAYQGVMDANANGQANVPVMGQIATNFLNSKRGQLAAMPAFKSGVTASPIDWNQYTALGGLLK